MVPHPIDIHIHSDIENDLRCPETQRPRTAFQELDDAQSLPCFLPLRQVTHNGLLCQDQTSGNGEDWFNSKNAGFSEKTKNPASVLLFVRFKIWPPHSIHAFHLWHDEPTSNTSIMWGFLVSNRPQILGLCTKCGFFRRVGLPLAWCAW